MGFVQFPTYVNTHSETLSPEDKTRYENQMDRIKKILAVFESPGYSDDNKETSAEVVELMSEVGSFLFPFSISDKGLLDAKLWITTYRDHG